MPLMASRPWQPCPSASCEGRVFRSAIRVVRPVTACRWPARQSWPHQVVPQLTPTKLGSRCKGHSTTLAALAVNNRQPTQRVLDTWRSAQAVCFDVDSTLCEDESIDELAAFLGLGPAVAALTANAMGGLVLFQDALAARLDLMQPSRQQIEAFLQAHPPRLSPGIPELVRLLQQCDTAVFLVSGGFRVIINPIADILGIPRTNVFANTILHHDDEEGSYAGFDPEEFTSRSGGKAEAIRVIKGKHGYSPLVMVGDGATDLEARQPGGADMFIGYGGVVERPVIAAAADWYVHDIQALIDALQT